MCAVCIVGLLGISKFSKYTNNSKTVDWNYLTVGYAKVILLTYFWIGTLNDIYLNVARSKSQFKLQHIYKLGNFDYIYIYI